jgi:phage tail-like protein
MSSDVNAPANPYRTYNFILDLGADVKCPFYECSGLGVKVKPIRYREGGKNQIVHVIPGRVEYADVTLRYGMLNSKEIWDWLMSAVEGKVTRKNVSIIFLDSDGTTEVVRWNLTNAWPNEWRGAPLDALGNEIAIETLTLVYEGITREAK